MMDENRLDNIVECSYNMDNGYVEVWYVDENMLRIKCEEVEAALRTTEQSLAKLHKLLDNKPIEYVAMALSGEMQAYCDIEDEMVKGMFGTIVQGYLKKGYNRATAEMMAREFFCMKVEIKIDVWNMMLYTIRVRLCEIIYMMLDNIVSWQKGGMICFILH